MAIGCVIWMIALGLVGKAVGSQWPKWKSHLDIVDYIAVAFVAALVVWFVYEKIWKPRVAARANVPTSTPVAVSGASARLKLGEAIGLGPAARPGRAGPGLLLRTSDRRSLPGSAGSTPEHRRRTVRKAFEVALHAGHRGSPW